MGELKGAGLSVVRGSARTGRDGDASAMTVARSEVPVARQDVRDMDR